MRKLLLLCCLLSSASLFAQQLITGMVKDRKTQLPLPFANVVSSTGLGTITDMDGKFQIVKNQDLSSLSISYVGYTTKTVPIVTSTNFYTIDLDENIESLNEVVLNAVENPALSIIKKAIEHKKLNNPEDLLKSFKFNAYNKLVVTANPDSINGAIDSVFIKKNGALEFSKVDSSNYELKKQLDRAHLYMTEKVSTYAFTQEKGKRETILATKMAGLKEPIYEVLALQIQSFSFYENKYTLFGTSYINPIADGALRTYNYRVLDTVNKSNRPAYMIYYFPKKKGKTARLEGVLYIDTETYALQKAIAQLKAVVDVKATQNFNYFENEKVWFPVSKEIKIEKGKNNEALSFFGSALKISGSETTQDTTVVHTNKTDASKLIQLISKEQNFDIQLNQPVTIKGRGLAMEIDEKASNRDVNFWNSYRTDSITTRGHETYVYVDSLAKAEKIEKKIGLVRKLTQGYLTTKYLDFDLRYLIKYNNYEGFKPGIGTTTNDAFSKKYRLSGYGIYGFKDNDFKYGASATAQLNRRTGTWLGAFYMDDLVETGSSPFITDGRTFYVFEPRLFNLTLFQKTKQLGMYLEHDITSKLQTKIQLSKSDVAPTFDYTYLNKGRSFTNYKISSAQIAVHYTPFNEYMLTDAGKMVIKKGYPQFTVQVSQSIDGFLDADFNFTKLDFRAMFEKKIFQNATTSFLIRSGIGFGDIPLTHLYHASPNNPANDAIMRRFSVADVNSFETMYYNEFFSDRYASFQLRHKLQRFKITSKFSPELVFVSRFAIGDIANRENHIGLDFNKLNKGFLESGLELNKLFKGFGISTFYRYGPNGLPRFDQNFSFKFTFNFGLGF